MGRALPVQNLYNNALSIYLFCRVKGGWLGGCDRERKQARYSVYAAEHF